MAARPPPTGGDDEPNLVEFGIVALEPKLDERDVSFPASAAELADHSDIQVAVGPTGHELAFGEALSRCDREQFESKTELLDCLHPVFEAERQARSGGVIGRIRSALPF